MRTMPRSNIEETQNHLKKLRIEKRNKIRLQDEAMQTYLELGRNISDIDSEIAELEKGLLK